MKVGKRLIAVPDWTPWSGSEFWGFFQFFLLGFFSFEDKMVTGFQVLLMSDLCCFFNYCTEIGVKVGAVCSQ